MRRILWLWGLVAALLVTSCPRVLPQSAAPSLGKTETTLNTLPPLVGKVSFGVPRRRTQADLNEVATAATITLIDPNTGYAVGSTVSRSDGGFSLAFTQGPRPPVEQVLYLEADKGLRAGTQFPNRNGAPVARVRTLVMNHLGSWQSITGQSLYVNATTTALCLIQSLRSATPPAANRQIPPSSLLAIMLPVDGTATTPAPYFYPNSTLLPPTFVTSAYQGVLSTLAQDKDPFMAIGLDNSDAPNYNKLLFASNVVSVAALSPNVQTIGANLDVVGSGFSATPSDNVVQFTTISGTPVQATVATVSADSARLTVTVPSGAITGPVSVTRNGVTIIGPTFYLALQSGHEAMDGNGNLYVSNESFGTIAQISPQGQIKTFVTGLVSPRALSMRQNMLYVLCAGAQKGVLVVDPNNPNNPATAYGTQGVIQDPRGIAFDSTGRCFVSDGANSALYEVDSTASTPVSRSLTGTALANPHGLAFGADGRLYVANTNANNVLAINLATSVSSPYLQGFSAPWGVAFDSLGNFYVSNNTGNSVYRLNQQTGVTAPFASVPNPGALVTDRAGYVYAIDRLANNLYRITPSGDSAIFASGISYPTGISKVGSLLYVLSQSNNALMAIDTGSTAISTVARGFNQPMGLAYDSVRDVFYVSNNGNGTITRVARTTGAVSTVLTGLPGPGSGPGGIAYLNGRLYVPNGTTIQSYDVTNFAASPLTTSTVINNLQGLSKDTSASPNTGSFYIVTGTGNRVLRVLGDASNTGYNSANANNYVTVFKDSVGDTNLNNPVDVTVDGSGNVWVANSGGNSVTSYTPAGTTYLAPISSGTQPNGIGFDGTNVWVVNYGSQNIKAYNPATGALVTTLTCGTDHPRNLCFNGTTMYVALDEGIGTITSYATTPSYSRITTLGSFATSLAVGNDGSIYFAVNSGSAYQILPNLSSSALWYQNYNNITHLWKVPGGGDYYFTDQIAFGNVNQGNYAYRMAGAAQNGHVWKLAGVDANGNVYTQGLTRCDSDSLSRIQTGSPQREWWYRVWDNDCYSNCSGALAADTLGNEYFAIYQGAGISKIDANGNLSTVIGNGGADQTSFGLWADPTGASVYETINSYHRVDQINVSTGVRTTLPYGLSSAEL